jgi:hypothetical protein
MRNAYKILVRYPKGENYLGVVGVVERIMLKLILKFNVWCGLDSSGSG